jgi:hypothetical protein
MTKKCEMFPDTAHGIIQVMFGMTNFLITPNLMIDHFFNTS